MEPPPEGETFVVSVYCGPPAGIPNTWNSARPALMVLELTESTLIVTLVICLAAKVYSIAFPPLSRGPVETVEPYFRDTLAFDRHRLAEIDAQIAGVPYETDDPGWLLGGALAHAAGKDPELLRGLLEIVSLLARGEDVLARPGVAERALELGTDGEPLPGPTRAELLALVAG